MLESEFEKQVQQKIEELAFNPSAKVWQNVAVAIAKRKRTHLVFFIFFLSLLLVGSGIFITLKKINNKQSNVTAYTKEDAYKTSVSTINNKHGKAIDSNKNILKNNGQDIVSNSSTVTSQIVVAISKSNHQSAIPTDKKITSVALPSTKKSIKNKSAGQVKNDGNLLASVTKIKYKGKQKLSVSTSNGAVDELTDDKADRTKIPIEPTENFNDTALQQKQKVFIEKDKQAVTKFVKDTVTALAKADTNNTKPSVKIILPKQKHNWQTGINFSIGQAAAQAGLLGIGGNKAFNNLSYSTPSPPNNNQGPPGQSVYTPSNLKPGVGIVVGLFAQKSISPKTTFAIGLNYKMYTSSLLVGNLTYGNNSAILSTAYYQNGTNKQYKNYFHFIELPVTMSFKLNRQNHVPIYLNTGISISRLVSSNALQFNPSNGIYYHDNALLNKIQFGASAALLFSLSKQKNAFVIGPVINYSFNKVAATGLYSNRNYNFIGVKLQKTIGKK